MSRPKVVVTRRWPRAVEDVLSEEYDVTFNRGDRALTAGELREAIATADAVLPTVTDRIDAGVLDVARPCTKILANYGVGYSHIDVAAAKGHGIAITNTPDVLSECTADLALTLMLMVARRTGEGEREIKTETWHGWCPTHLLGAKVSGKTLGIIGYGRIGQEVAKRAHFGFGMRILACNRSPVRDEVLAETNAQTVASIDELLPQCDFVSLHCPGGAANRHLIDARRINLMKPSAFLINTARGEIVDEHALAHSLWFETIGGAGLDVFASEPNVPSELRLCDNAVLLPHLGSATVETREAMGFRVVQNLKDFFAGGAPQDLVA